mmetsp:Transcript_4890/g.11449  ORF Transcript_4890/g.11449 Transcript_4890/m.11449 type:complete len:333 (-) Transcript_4890:80-1078(-)|eukprot:CAMPEP_0114557306 /NCGR_PEP_ID=MMETSP0114-20121206/9761_1 /TAXON_ID=31324 /ORGANISM="Goniomonas sp, Strain m" /LENGTH=332 /DNA_ID=CAMNT_0001742587 /DNA_START=18 /DNA_END=1016 /DNA_ORIENTATION=-
MANQLEELRKHTVVVCDSGDLDAIAKYKPTDATTNPSLVFQAAQLPQYRHLVEEAVAYGKAQFPGVDLKQSPEAISKIVDKLTVNFGLEILKIIPGYCSTEVNPRLSFSVEQSVAKAHELIALYADAGIGKDRVLIKLASTWEGIQACRLLEAEGIHCNMTLMFTLAQAVGAAEANATLVSPFVGRILDWYKNAEKKDSYPADQDPGCLSVKSIFSYYKQHGHKTIVMGASFRNKDEILELCGCDRLTISPKLLGELESSTEPVQVKLVAGEGEKIPAMKSMDGKGALDEPAFRWNLNEDQMATEKLSEGIRGFNKDLVKLEQFIIKEFLQA